MARRAAELCPKVGERAKELVAPYDERQRVAEQHETSVSADERYISWDWR